MIRVEVHLHNHNCLFVFVGMEKRLSELTQRRLAKIILASPVVVATQVTVEGYGAVNSLFVNCVGEYRLERSWLCKSVVTSDALHANWLRLANLADIITIDSSHHVQHYASGLLGLLVISGEIKIEFLLRFLDVAVGTTDTQSEGEAAHVLHKLGLWNVFGQNLQVGELVRQLLSVARNQRHQNHKCWQSPGATRPLLVPHAAPPVFMQRDILSAFGKEWIRTVMNRCWTGTKYAKVQIWTNVSRCSRLEILKLRPN